MIHVCHPFQLGGRYETDTPEPYRKSFALDLPCRLMKDDHVQYDGGDFIVVFLQFRDGSDQADVRVKYNGKAHALEPYYEKPFRSESYA